MENPEDTPVPVEIIATYQLCIEIRDLLEQLQTDLNFLRARVDDLAAGGD